MRRWSPSQAFEASHPRPIKTKSFNPLLHAATILTGGTMLVPCKCSMIHTLGTKVVEEGAISTIAIALHHIVSWSVTLPFSPAAGQFNLPVSDQLMTPHTEPRNHLQPMDGVDYGPSRMSLQDYRLCTTDYPCARCWIPVRLMRYRYPVARLIHPHPLRCCALRASPCFLSLTQWIS